MDTEVFRSLVAPDFIDTMSTSQESTKQDCIDMVVDGEPQSGDIIPPLKMTYRIQSVTQRDPFHAMPKHLLLEYKYTMLGFRGTASQTLARPQIKCMTSPRASINYVRSTLCLYING